MIGSRQSGKTTLALDIADGMSAIYLDLLRQSGETLAGRIAYVNLTPITALEFGSGAAARDRLWLRGGLRLPSRKACAMRSAIFSRSAASSSTLARTGFPSPRMSRWSVFGPCAICSGACALAPEAGSGATSRALKFGDLFPICIEVLWDQGRALAAVGCALVFSGSVFFGSLFSASCFDPRWVDESVSRVTRHLSKTMGWMVKTFPALTSGLLLVQE